MIAEYQVRLFELTNLIAAMSFAEQGGVAVHLERRRFSGPRWHQHNLRDARPAYRVIGQREQLRAWGRDHAQWDRDLQEQEGEPGLFFFVVVGEPARRALLESRPASSDVS